MPALRISTFSSGSVTPMPTLPAAVIRILSETFVFVVTFLVPKTKSPFELAVASVV